SGRVAARIPALALRLPHQTPRALPAPPRLPPLRLHRAGALHDAEPHSPRGEPGACPSGAPPTRSSLCSRRVSVMGPLTVSTWVRLDAFFAGLALLLLLYPRWVPQRPGVERTLWIKLGVFFLVVHATMVVIGLGGLWLKAAMVLVAAVGS